MLTFFGNICRQSNDNLEKLIAYRQLNLKSNDSSSWFIEVKSILAKYQLPSAFELLDTPRSKYEWKNIVNKAVSDYWREHIEGCAKLYPTLQYLSTHYIPGKTHPIVNLSSRSIKEVQRIIVKLRIATGNYKLMTDMAYYNKNKNLSAVCPMCKLTDESLEHFLLRCTALSEIRHSIVNEIIDHYNNLYHKYHLDDDTSLLQIIIDPNILKLKNSKIDSVELENIEFHSRRLCYTLHSKRAKLLSDEGSIHK